MTLLIPIARFKYFVRACLQNITETCGIPLDICFLTDNSKLNAEFEEESKNFKFRVVRVPFNAGNNQCKMLDWAVKNLDIGKWFMVQHCDNFWIKDGWGTDVMNAVETFPDIAAFYLPLDHYFKYKSKPIHHMHDYFGLYNREKLLDYNLVFTWGKLGVDVPMSPELQEAVESRFINTRIGHYIDGSVTLSMELAVRHPDEVMPLPIHDKMNHIWSIFRYAENISIKGSVMNFGISYDRVPRLHATGFHNMLPFLANYSRMTSFLFDIDDVKDCVLPWRIFKHLAKDHNLEPAIKLVDGLMKYQKYPNVLGDSTMGIREIHFRNVKYNNFIKI